MALIDGIKNSGIHYSSFRNQLNLNSTLSGLHSRKIYLTYVRSNWIRSSRPHFRPLSRIVCVFYNTTMGPHGMYFTRNRPYTRYLCASPTPSRHNQQLPTHRTFESSQLTTISSGDMAPRISPAKLVLIRDMIERESFTTSLMAEQARCNKLFIIIIRRNLRQFGSIYAPQTLIGRKPIVTPLTIEALCDRLSKKPGFSLDEMAVFLRDEFQAIVATSSIRRALVAKCWS